MNLFSRLSVTLVVIAVLTGLAGCGNAPDSTSTTTGGGAGGPTGVAGGPGTQGAVGVLGAGSNGAIIPAISADGLGPSPLFPDPGPFKTVEIKNSDGSITGDCNLGEKQASPVAR